MAIVVKEDVSCYASDTQQNTLGIISGIDIITQRFFITGGTALSVQPVQRSAYSAPAGTVSLAAGKVDIEQACAGRAGNI